VLGLKLPEAVLSLEKKRHSLRSLPSLAIIYDFLDKNVNTTPVNLTAKSETARTRGEIFSWILPIKVKNSQALRPIEIY